MALEIRNDINFEEIKRTDHWYRELINQQGIYVNEEEIFSHYLRSNEYRACYEAEVEWWKDIPGYDGMYMISSKGRIYSFHVKRCLLLNFETAYPRIPLFKNGKRKDPLVHDLVAQAFIPKLNPMYTIVNHKDSIRYNNYVNNLEHCDFLYNNLYAKNRTKADELKRQRQRDLIY